jgi:hypothetical protein
VVVWSGILSGIPPLTAAGQPKIAGSAAPTSRVVVLCGGGLAMDPESIVSVETERTAFIWFDDGMFWGGWLC